jgi:uncharacterized protein
MTDENAASEPAAAEPAAKAPPRWKPLGPIDRRVIGVLAEKAKTTPDVYPMSLNGICTGCNQKSNRFPLMQLEPDDLEESLDRLRGLGAIGMVEGYGRVTKYRHYLYEWLGVDKVELAVITELLLRGAQTEGELRGRASRMEPIADLTALRPVLQSLSAKGLMVSLTPEGRGHVITHALYQPRELENLRAQFGTGRAPSAAPASGYDDESPGDEPPLPGAPAARQMGSSMPAAMSGRENDLVAGIRRDMAELRTQLLQLQSEVQDLASRQTQIADEVRELKDALGN